MRRLNLLRKEKPYKQKWREIQQKQIDDLNLPGLKLYAAFPGSFIFNQILVPTGAGSCHGNLVIPEVSDIVYANCSDKSRERGFENTIVIDIDEISDLSVVDVILSVIKDLPLCRVVLLGQEALDICGELLQDQAGSDVSVEMVEPDWNYAMVLHNIYRQAATVVFVNSMRVLDAAYTGCNCLLITDEVFREKTVFNVLNEQLHRVGCDVYDESGQLIVIKDTGLRHSTFQIVENSISAVECALCLPGAKRDDEKSNGDWLLKYAPAELDPVIASSHLPPSNVLSDLSDRKTRINRKIAKLRADPRAFFSDSDNEALRFVARTLWARSADG